MQGQNISEKLCESGRIVFKETKDFSFKDRPQKKADMEEYKAFSCLSIHHKYLLQTTSVKVLLINGIRNHQCTIYIHLRRIVNIVNAEHDMQRPSALIH